MTRQIFLLSFTCLPMYCFAAGSRSSSTYPEVLVDNSDTASLLVSVSVLATLLALFCGSLDLFAGAVFGSI